MPFTANINQNFHEGAARGRRMGNWGIKKSSPTQEIASDADTLRERSRTLRRNSAWADRAGIVDNANLIGTGIRPIASTNNEEFNKLVNNDFWNWQKQADYLQTNQSYYSLQALARMAKREAGECFIVAKKLRLDRNSKLLIPLQFQLLESEFCPMSLNSIAANGNEIKNGVELNNKGQVVAYWFYRSHPSDFSSITFNTSQLMRVLNKDVFHYFDKERPNQLRGKPKAVSSIVTQKTYDSYSDAELVRKEGRSAITGTIERESYSDKDFKLDPFSGQPIDRDYESAPMVHLESGTFTALLAGERLNVLNADDTGQGYKDYQTHQLLQIAASHGVPYQLLTGDWSSINDRVWRAIFNSYKRELEQDLELNFIPQVCDPIYEAFINRGIVTGRYDVSGFSHSTEWLKVQHKSQAHEFIHPEQDVNSIIKRLKAGLTSRSAVIASNGKHGESLADIDNERAMDRNQEEAQGLKSLANWETLPSNEITNTENTNNG